MSEVPRKSFVGKLIRFLLIVVVLILILGALAPTFLSGFVKDKVAEAMERDLDAEVSIGDLSFGWFSATEIRDFRLTRPGQAHAALEIGHLKTDPSFKEVLDGRFIVDDLVASDVVVRVSRTESGIDWTTISRGKKDQEKPAAEDLELPEFLLRARINNLRVVYDDYKLAQPVDLKGIQVQLTAELGKECSFELDGPHGLVAKLSMKAFDGRRLLPADQMTVGGTINLSALDLSDYAPHLGTMLQDLAGLLKSEQTLQYGPGGALTIKGRTEWQGFRAQHSAGGLSVKSGACVSTISMDRGQPQMVLGIQVQGAEVVGLPQQKAPIPCGAGRIDISFDATEVLAFTGGQFDIPGGRLLLNGTHGLGSTPGRGVTLKANTDLALWSRYFEELPDVKGTVLLDGSVPADPTEAPIAFVGRAEGLVLSGGPLKDKSWNCGSTTLAMKITMPKRADGPRKIDLSSKSRMWTIDVKSSLTADENAAFGFLGQAGIKGQCDLEGLLAPFSDSRGQGRVRFDFLAAFSRNEFAVQDATVSGPNAQAKFGARMERRQQQWRMLLNGSDIRYRRGDGVGILIPGLDGRGSWNQDTHDVQGRLMLADVRTLGGDGPPVSGGQVKVDFNGKVDKEAGACDLKFTSMKLAGFDGTGEVNYSKAGGLGRLRLEGQADYAELSSRWLRLFDPAAKGSGTGPVVVEFQPQGGDLSRAFGRIDMQIPQLSSHGFNISNLVVKGSMKDGRGTITQGEGQLNGGTVKLTGDLDMTSGTSRFNSAAKMENVRIVKEWQPAIARVIPLFAGIGVTAEGVINLDLTALGEGDTWDSIQPRLNGDGALGLLNGRIAGSPILKSLGLALGFNPNMRIQDISSAFKIRNGGIHQSGFVADLGVMQIRMSGTTFLDGRLDYDLGIKPVSQEPANWQRYVSLLSSDGFLPLKLTGTLDSPEPGLPDVSKIVEAGARKLIGGQIGNLLNGDKKGQKKNPLGGLLDGLKGKNKKDGNKKDPATPLDSLIKGLGGKPKKGGKDDGQESGGKNPLGGFLKGLGGSKKDPAGKDGQQKKKTDTPNVGGLLQGVLGGGKKKDKNQNKKN